jgi:arsenite-transporting ATPase
MKITKRAGGYQLALHLPFAGKDDLDLMRKGDDLYVRVGAYKRTFLLPTVLTRLDITGATFEDDRLVISFSKAGESPAPEQPKKRSTKRAPRATGAPKQARGGA